MICNNDHRVKEYWDAEIVFSDTGGEEDHTYSYLEFLITYCNSNERPNPKKIHIIARDLTLYDYMFSSRNCSRVVIVLNNLIHIVLVIWSSPIVFGINILFNMLV